MATFASRYSCGLDGSMKAIRDSVSEALESWSIDLDKVHVLVLLIGEALSDVVKHGHDTSVMIRASYDNPHLQISVKSVSFKTNRDDINRAISLIEDGQTIDFVETQCGLGLRFLCAMTECPPCIDEDGNLVASFNLSEWGTAERIRLCCVYRPLSA